MSKSFNSVANKYRHSLQNNWDAITRINLNTGKIYVDNDKAGQIKCADVRHCSGRRPEKHFTLRCRFVNRCTKEGKILRETSLDFSRAYVSWWAGFPIFKWRSHDKYFIRDVELSTVIIPFSIMRRIMVLKQNTFQQLSFAHSISSVSIQKFEIILQRGGGNREVIFKILFRRCCDKPLCTFHLLPELADGYIKTINPFLLFYRQKKIINIS